MATIKQVLMERDSMTSEEADDAINNARDDLRDLLADGNMMDAEDICQIHFGLEPDYIMELM